MDNQEYTEYMQKLSIWLEIGANILANYDRFFDKYNININDTDNPYVKNYFELVSLKYDDMYLANSVKELDEMISRIKQIDDFLKNNNTIKEDF